ncbi:Cytochrome P450 6j1 [Chionoecetes opilio]|uniref:Cytochrome P450 6j1 n=1 Tax=Chionoecetes opilio TaxID=41210 RepID=A0A8J4YF59_CHIOP|nr:Cytochrome P450 6j1 [Chionoecetes opilio]
MDGSVSVTAGELAVAGEAAEGGAQGVTVAVTCVLVALCCVLACVTCVSVTSTGSGAACPAPPPRCCSATPWHAWGSRGPSLRCNCFFHCRVAEDTHMLHELHLSTVTTRAAEGTRGQHEPQFFDELYYDYNGRDYCGFYDFLKPGLFVGNPQLIKGILVQNFHHFADRRTFDLAKVSPVANDMLTNARGSHWRRVRSAVSPAFTKSRTRRLYPLLLQRARQLLRLARTVCGRYTMDAIASCAFGLECEALDSEAALFPIMAARVFQLSPVRALKVGWEH